MCDLLAEALQLSGMVAMRRQHDLHGHWLPSPQRCSSTRGVHSWAGSAKTQISYLAHPRTRSQTRRSRSCPPAVSLGTGQRPRRPGQAPRDVRHRRCTPACMHASGKDSTRTPHQRLLAPCASQIWQCRTALGSCQLDRRRCRRMVEQGMQTAGLAWQPLRRGAGQQLRMRREAAVPRSSRRGRLVRLEAGRGRPLGESRAG